MRKPNQVEKQISIVRCKFTSNYKSFNYKFCYRLKKACSKLLTVAYISLMHKTFIEQNGVILLLSYNTF